MAHSAFRAQSVHLLFVVIFPHARGDTLEDPGRRKRKAFLFDDKVCCLEKTERRKTNVPLLVDYFDNKITNGDI